MASLLLLNKPFNTLCQFTDKLGRDTLANSISDPLYSKFYPAGRLDYDSEGLVALTDSGELQHRLADPKFKLPKTYWVQVEGAEDSLALARLEAGIELNDGPTRPCKVKLISEPNIWERQPPIRQREAIGTHWLELTITEGRNRQVRRMTAAVGLPTLRLIRKSIGNWSLESLQPGEFRAEAVHLPASRPASHRKSKAVDFNKKTPSAKGKRSK